MNPRKNKIPKRYAELKEISKEGNPMNRLNRIIITNNILGLLFILLPFILCNTGFIFFVNKSNKKPAKI